MSRASTLRQRLDRLISLVRPPNSIAAKVAALDEDERETFEAWRRLSRKWIARHESWVPGGAWRAVRDGEPSPHLPGPIHNKIFGPTPGIPAGASIEEAARIYAEFKDRR